MANAVFAAILLFGGIVTGFVARYWNGWGIDQPYNPALVMAPFLVLALVARAALRSIAEKDRRRKQEQDTQED